MFRRVVSLLLLPCLVLLQPAAWGHAHCGHAHDGQDFRPHIHVNPTQTHHHGCHRHAEQPTPPAQAIEPHSDHDADAIYLAVTDLLTVGRFHVDSGWNLVFWATTPGEPTAHLGAAGDCLVPLAHPPPVGGGACPIYVKHLALLI